MTRETSSPPPPDKSRGAALLLFLLVIVIGFASFLLSSFSTHSSEAQRQRKTMEALAQAKEALIGRAASDANRPGSLPCPDVENDDGVTELFNGIECKAYIGRFPWKTLGLPELHDGHGEKLWYALSRGIRDNDDAHPINPNKNLELTLDGQPNIAAIIFSPGPQLAAQNARPSNNIADYLDEINHDGLNIYISGPRSETFNDQALAVTRDDIFRVVNRRILGEVRDLLLKSDPPLPSDFSVLSPPPGDANALSTLKMLTYNGWIPPPSPLPSGLTPPTLPKTWPTPTVVVYQLNGDDGKTARITIGDSSQDVVLSTTLSP